MRAIICLIFLAFTLKAFPADNYMFFGLSSLLMEKKSSDDFLSGDAFADRIYVMMSDNEFEITSTGNNIFKAGTYLTDDRIYFAKDGMKFSTTLDKTNPLFSLTRLEIKKVEAELAKEFIGIKGDLLNARFEDLTFIIQNIDMTCLTGGDFTTDIDIACMQNTKILPLDGFETGFVQLKDESDKKEFVLDIDSRELRIDESNIYVDAHKIDGNYKGGEYLLSNGTLNCFKFSDIDGIDVDKIMIGCLKRAEVESEGFKFKKSGLNMEISRAGIGMSENEFSVSAAYASFLTNDGVTYVSAMKVECAKNIIDINDIGTHMLLNGCLENMSLTIRNIENDDKFYDGLSLEDREFEEKTRIKDINLKVRDSKFTLKAKFKTIFSIPMLVTGKVTFSEMANQIIIKVDKARVAGIPTKKLALSLVKKFIDSSQVKVRGDEIIINF